MATKRDFYEVLGIEKGASSDDVKRAYRRLARQYHPDVNRHDENAEARFREATEAYETLSDPQRRSQYDLYGHNGGPSFGDFGFGGFTDLFDAFFGGFERQSRQQTTRDMRGADLRLDVEITLEEAAFGTKKSLRVNRLILCETCHGKGGRAGTGPVPCQACHGEGRVRHSSGLFGVQFTSVTACDRCQGTGSIITDPCDSCHGKGRTRKTIELEASIPAGVDSGHRLRVDQQGDTGLRGAPAGDLYLFIHVLPHEVFERRGTELICEAPLPFSIAALGGAISVPTLEGETEVQIPAGTQTGSTFRLRGLGISEPNGYARGDQHVVVKIVVPTRLNSKQRQLLRQYAETEALAVDDDKGILERVKDVLGG